MTALLSDTRGFFLSNLSAKSPEYTYILHGYDALDQNGHYSFWPFVTSPIARRVLTYLYEKADTDENYIRMLLDSESVGKRNEELSLWHRLNQSGISILLAEGGELPETETVLSRYFRFVNRPRKKHPRLEDQLEELLASLDIRLIDPDYRMFSLRPQLILPWPFAVSLCYFIPRLFFTSNKTEITLAWLNIIAIVVRQFYYPPPARGDNSQTNATLLYHYLLREFSDDLDEPEIIKEPDVLPPGIIVR